MSWISKYELKIPKIMKTNIRPLWLRTQRHLYVRLWKIFLILFFFKFCFLGWEDVYYIKLLQILGISDNLVKKKGYKQMKTPTKQYGAGVSLLLSSKLFSLRIISLNELAQYSTILYCRILKNPTIEFSSQFRPSF